MEFHRYRDADCRGTVEKIRYTACDEQGAEKEKYANVYLPCGYEPATCSSGKR